MNIDESIQLTPKAAARTLANEGHAAQHPIDTTPYDRSIAPPPQMDACYEGTAQDPARLGATPTLPPAGPLPPLPQETASVCRPAQTQPSAPPELQMSPSDYLHANLDLIAPETINFFGEILEAYGNRTLQCPCIQPGKISLAELLLCAVERDLVVGGHLDALGDGINIETSCLIDVRSKVSRYIQELQLFANLCLDFLPDELVVARKLVDNQPLWGVCCDLTQDQSYQHTALARLVNFLEGARHLPLDIRGHFMQLAASDFVEDPRAKMQDTGLGVALPACNSEVLVRLAENFFDYSESQREALRFTFSGIFQLAQAFNHQDLSGSPELFNHLLDVQSQRPQTWKLHAQTLFQLRGLRLAEAAEVGEALLAHQMTTYESVFAAALTAAEKRAAQMRDNEYATSYNHSKTLRLYALLDKIDEQQPLL